MPTNFESGLIALSTVLGTALVLLVIYANRAACSRAVHVFRGNLFANEASSPHDIASASGVEIFANDLGSLEQVTDNYAIAQMEGVAQQDRQDWTRGATLAGMASSGRPEPRLHVDALVDFQAGATTAGVGDAELFEGSATQPTLGTIEEAPGGVAGMHGASTDFVSPEELVSGDVGDNTPLTSQGHAGGIIGINPILQTNHAKQDYGSAYSMLTQQWAPNPSREECKHLCLNGGSPAYVDLCDCRGYIDGVGTTGLGPLERNMNSMLAVQ